MYKIVTPHEKFEMHISLIQNSDTSLQTQKFPQQRGVVSTTTAVYFSIMYILMLSENS
jgi:hypothetical protein